MTFTSTLPAIPGAYWWKGYDDAIPRLAEVWQEGHLYAKSEGQDAMVDELGGLWCRLCPSDELEKAYKEGCQDSEDANASDAINWNFDTLFFNSCARRIAEGTV